MANERQAFPSVLDTRFYEVAKPASFGERALILARDRIYADFMAMCSPTAEDTILDIGVSDVLTDGANLLERLYPRPEKISACGLGEAKEFQTAFPQIRYLQLAPAEALPYTDKEFDIAASNAVLEHVGNREKQTHFISEMVRVARQVFITVPNRFFPIEHHTALPLAHWTDSSFRLACALTGKHKWTQEEELTLMSKRLLSSLVPEGKSYRVGYTGLSLGPFSSNLYLTIC
ncbi:MAG TPA: methyltransferase domain-containing protein [Stellaceae bacterium]|nr:methyltransferase domain-containing protein [Stellaceae bacterium]